ncbi:HIT family protein [Evansella cellulosilytica]|uniref:Histidine triad (HIT) protein n=1 Tax=Evansella cellulosilytica (strain ATCC 21833 / DSM 2522 / FERM P-1141 / JCM 9156 / N-4) TaxID=649639 RepID=E6TRW4_EVAC2|nr:HIT family protein [Evansella cellulosilytica]ADU29487.1 histidine triad (HIT) protein [Evansella cellulosilytica DSM 2522]
MEESCFICNKHQGTIITSGATIYEDDYIFVGHIDNNGKPNYLGHIMIDLKRHVPTLAEMNPEEAKTFGVIMARLSRALKETEGAEHVYALVSGNAVPHLHMHLVARYPNTHEQFWGPFAVYDDPNARMGENSDVIQLCNRLKDYLETNPYE